MSARLTGATHWGTQAGLDEDSQRKVDGKEGVKKIGKGGQRRDRYREKRKRGEGRINLQFIYP